MANSLNKSTVTKIGLLAVLISLAACGGRSTVVTQDDSADYRGAKSLPPLKKPGSPTSSGTVTATAPAVEPATDSNTQTSEAIEPTPVAAPTTGVAAPVTASVVERGDGQVVLAINSDVDAAWTYLRRSLNRSDITVHTRNKAAGRFAIGCAGVDSEEEVETTRRGGWSFFKRTAKETEHCGMQLVSSKGSSTVVIYDRSGQPVAAEQARGLFARLIKQ